MHNARRLIDYYRNRSRISYYI